MHKDARLFASSKKDFSQMPPTDIITELVNYKQKLK